MYKNLLGDKILLCVSMETRDAVPGIIQLVGPPDSDVGGGDDDGYVLSFLKRQTLEKRQY